MKTVSEMIPAVLISLLVFMLPVSAAENRADADSDKKDECLSHVFDVISPLEQNHAVNDCYISNIEVLNDKRPYIRLTLDCHGENAINIDIIPIAIDVHSYTSTEYFSINYFSDKELSETPVWVEPAIMFIAQVVRDNENPELLEDLEGNCSVIQKGMRVIDRPESPAGSVEDADASAKTPQTPAALSRFYIWLNDIDDDYKKSLDEVRESSGKNIWNYVFVSRVLTVCPAVMAGVLFLLWIYVTAGSFFYRKKNPVFNNTKAEKPRN